MASGIQPRGDSSGALVALPKKAVLVRTGAVVAAIAAVGLAAPLIGSAVMGGAGLLVLGGFAVVGVGFFQALPLLGQKWENKLLQLRKEEARQNPIEQRQNSLITRQNNLGKYKDALALIGGNINTMETNLENRKRNRPQGDYSRAEKQLQSMKTYYAGEIKKLVAATEKLNLLKERVEDEAFMYQFAQDGKMAITGLKGASSADPTNEVLDQVASFSVEREYDELFATVELDAVLAQAEQIRANQQTSGLDAIDAEFTEMSGGKI